VLGSPAASPLHPLGFYSSVRRLALHPAVPLSPVFILRTALRMPVVCRVLYTLEVMSLLWTAVAAMVRHSRGNLGEERTEKVQLKGA